MKTTPKAKSILKMIYLYILSFVGIIITVVAMIGLLNLVIREYVFQVSPYETYPEQICSNPKVVNGNTTPPTQEEIVACEEKQVKQDKERAANDTKRDLAGHIAGIVIGLPLWLYHWGLIRKEKEGEV